MAKDYLNVIERALMMAISDKINSVTGSGEDVYVFGQFPETEELKFPAVVVQQVASGIEEKFFGDNIVFGSDTAPSQGEAYGIGFNIHLFVEKETMITVAGIEYKQRRLLNWLMLNIGNALNDIDWSLYEEEELEILERHVLAWNDIGHMPQLQWYGSTCTMSLVFLNKR
jgi:hypothetical protein